MSSEEYIREAVATLWDRYRDPLSLDELAHVARMSKFHFIRVFRQTTGVSPGRFLAAVRLHKSKYLLRTTRLSAAEVSLAVGYHSVGTFTRRFTEAVGVSPIQYRRMAHGKQPMVPVTATGSGRRDAGAVRGVVHRAETPDTRFFVGVFPGRILQSSPVAGAVVHDSEPFYFPAVPAGSWYLLAVALGPDHRDGGSPPGGCVGPLRVRQFDQLAVDITIRRPDWRCPPIVAVLPSTHLRGTLGHAVVS
ncbi:helix-turn-helix transcriptional regulator [Micromonospora sp. STR1_7]|uniref:Helix-turn-helix transcriptional regulator n=1 Tax=Micromonospora parastrephiae TaxID=2806101 RepID=A0ABS1XQ52_9ACTN|nr:helix-turn-helix transcriptional regulator [Micromonospora parastrephiae]MBM0231390.1 helix-turn-helix transcriptional regulator [Micromonospora parastrephiae]